jgi:RNA polymerase sigma-70 factor (ECF subfamily)
VERGAAVLGSDFPAVLAAARTGDAEAWRRLHDDVSGPLLGFLRGRGLDDPEDVLGDVLLDLARSLRSFAGDESGFRAWLFTIAHRRAVDAVRRAVRRPATPFPVEELAPMLDATAGTEAIDAVVDRLALGGRLEALLAELTDEQREVLVLRFAADLDATTVGTVTGRSTNAVAAITRRGLARLRELAEAGVTTSASGSGAASPDAAAGR